MVIPWQIRYVIKLEGGVNIETLYKITNKINNKFYIGSTSDFDRRIQNHIHCCENSNYKRDYKVCPSLYRDMIKMGRENFILEKVFESENKIELSRMESKLIRENKSNTLMYNNTLGASGRRVLSNEDVYFIRELYNTKKIYITEAYDIYYKNIVTYRAFKKAWHGETFKDVHYDVYTKENKEWHFSKGQSRPGEMNRSSKYTESEVISIRKRRDLGENREDVWKDYKDKGCKTAFVSIWKNINWTYLLNT